MQAPQCPTRAVLEALETFRDLDALVSLNSIVAFLTLCDREGVSMKELAFLTRMSEATASRAIRTLEAPTAPTALAPGLGLVEILRSAADGRSRLVHLTARGREIKERLAADVRARLHVNIQ